MTEAERISIHQAIADTRVELEFFEGICTPGANLETLYQAAKPVHESALGIWSTVVNVIRAQHNLSPSTERSLTDAINLDELFEKENGCGN